jgi:hypothetical protein
MSLAVRAARRPPGTGQVGLLDVAGRPLPLLQQHAGGRVLVSARGGLAGAPAGGRADRHGARPGQGWWPHVDRPAPWPAVKRERPGSGPGGGQQPTSWCPRGDTQHMHTAEPGLNGPSVTRGMCGESKQGHVALGRRGRERLLSSGAVRAAGSMRSGPRSPRRSGRRTSHAAAEVCSPAPLITSGSAADPRTRRLARCSLPIGSERRQPEKRCSSSCISGSPTRSVNSSNVGSDGSAVTGVPSVFSVVSSARMPAVAASSVPIG